MVKLFLRHLQRGQRLARMSQLSALHFCNTDLEIEVLLHCILKELDIRNKNICSWLLLLLHFLLGFTSWGTKMVNILKVSRYWTLTIIHVFSAFKFYLSINTVCNTALYYKDGSELGKEAISFPSLFVGIPFFVLLCKFLWVCCW